MIGVRLKIESIGGINPVVADGTANDAPFFFLSNDIYWSMSIGAKHPETLAPWHHTAWHPEGTAGGFISDGEAHALILDAATRYSDRLPGLTLADDVAGWHRQLAKHEQMKGKKNGKAL